MLAQSGQLHLLPISSYGGPRGNGQDRTLLEACRSFEACLIQLLLETAGIDRQAGALGTGGISQETYGYMWAQALAESVAEGGGLGLAELLASELEAHSGMEGGGSGTVHCP